MKPHHILLVAMLAVLAVPFALRNEEEVFTAADDRVVIVTPHNESIRQEFTQAFGRWYQEKTGRTVYIDWRVIGGTSEIARFLVSEYTNAFRNHWTNDLYRRWTAEVAAGYDNHRIELDDSAENDTPAESARRAWLDSEVSCGLDIFFGGGAYDFAVQAHRGALVDSGLRDRHPTWFIETAPAGIIPEAIPRKFAGETYWDQDGLWIGACLSSYSLIFNRDSLRRLGIERDLNGWGELADPRLLGEVAVCDPSKSGSMTQAMEMIIQQQMHLRLAELIQEAPQADLESLEKIAVAEGWLRGMSLLQRISGNARYFTDTSQKPNIDVSLGDCAAGMSIDFYARFQQESVNGRGGEGRFGVDVVRGGTTVSADPIGLLRGAPNRPVAELFIEFVMSLEGQKLWNFEVGTPGGPETYALRRLPIRPELYREPFNTHRSDADVISYVQAADFTYRGDWTGRHFSAIRFLIRHCYIDVLPELRTAWRALIENQFPPKATALFDDLTMIDMEATGGVLRDRMNGGPREVVRLARELSGEFRNRYLRVTELAQNGQ
jgi:iron(III) transport system substrate-binding protein